MDGDSKDDSYKYLKDRRALKYFFEAFHVFLTDNQCDKSLVPQGVTEDFIKVKFPSGSTIRKTAHSVLKKFAEHFGEEPKDESSSAHASPATKLTIRGTSLILVFGKSQQINIDELKGISEIDAMHRQILKGYEWFWHGEHKDVPDLSKDDQGSMFWIQIDYSGGVINVNQKVKTYLQITDLLDRLVNKELKLNSIKTGGPFNYECLSQRGFLKA